MNHNLIDDKKFLAWLTLAMIVASLWIFKSYVHYMLVAAVLALATSHLYRALIDLFTSSENKGLIHNNKEMISAFIMTALFLMMIFAPLLYFVSVTYDQISNLDIAQIKSTLTQMVDSTVHFLKKTPLLQEPLERIKREGISFITGPAIEAGFQGATSLAVGVGGLLGQIVWILLFYFLFNTYGRKILCFLAELVPMSYKHETYLYKECTGTVAVVFYGTLFNMIAQGIAFGLLMVFIGDYSAVYLGVLAGFCSVIPIVGAAMVYVPVIALELFAGNVVNALVILVFAWVIMGFFIDNILRLIFIGFLKRIFGFEYTMNEILILLAILAGIASVGFWGLIIGPSVLALTLAAANLYSSGLDDGTEKDIQKT